MVVGILIAAAGKSTRFQHAGGHGNKLNSGLGTKTVFEKTLLNSMATGLPVHVVTRPDNQGVIDHCLQLNIPFSLLDSEGLGETIGLGVKNTAHWTGWLIHLADMPYVQSHVFIQVAEKLKDYPLARPVYGEKPGHPVGISAKYFQQLINLTGDDGAKSILSGGIIYKIEINDQSVVVDIDYPRGC